MPTLIEIAKRAQIADVTDQVFNPQDGFIVEEGDFGEAAATSSSRTSRRCAPSPRSTSPSKAAPGFARRPRTT